MPPPNPGKKPPPTLEALLSRAVAATKPRRRAKALDRAARLAAKGPHAAKAFRTLVAAGEQGPRLALEFLGRFPGKLPPDLIQPALVLLKQKTGTVAVRLAAAGTLLDSLPDTVDGIKPVLATLTGGKSRTRSLERLIQLQSRTQHCTTLDKVVAATEAKVPIKCPKCPARLTRSALVPHLWHKHRLVWERGTVRNPQALVDAAMTAGAKADPDRGPGPVDRAFKLTGLYFPEVPPGKVFQALAARGAVMPTQLDPLLDRAAEDRCGLCPACLSPLADPLPPLPPRLPLGGGRLVGEGFAVDVLDTPAGRTVTVTATGETTPVPGGTKTAARTVAALAAAPLFAAAVGVAAFLPRSVMAPVPAVLLASAAGWGTYLGVRFLRKPVPEAANVAVDRAWDEIVPDLGRKPAALRFLARLCRTSVGRGTPDDRARSVADVVEWAAANADRGGLHLQLLAAARVLQVFDGAVGGREKVAGLAGVFTPFLRGELPLPYAEAAAEAALTASGLTSGEAERLAVVLTGRAFEAGFLPGDLTAIGPFAPWMKRLLRDPSDLHLRAFYWLWRYRTNRRWEEVGPAKPVFDLAESSPSAARKILGQFPDALLRLEADDAVEKELGPLLVCTTGVTAGGAVVADPDALVQVSENGRELRFGTHRVGLDKKLSPKVAAALKSWLRFRARVLLPGADAIDPRPGAKAAAALAPLALQCPLCSAVSVVRTGLLGVRWEELTGGGR